jgi:hypothetical protein
MTQALPFVPMALITSTRVASAAILGKMRSLDVIFLIMLIKMVTLGLALLKSVQRVKNYPQMRVFGPVLKITSQV